MTDTHTHTHTQTDRQTDASDLIICPMLCYSNGTDNYRFDAVIVCILHAADSTSFFTRLSRVHRSSRDVFSLPTHHLHHDRLRHGLEAQERYNHLVNLL